MARDAKGRRPCNRGWPAPACLAALEEPLGLKRARPPPTSTPGSSSAMSSASTRRRSIAPRRRPVGESDVARALALAERRIAGEPVARIVGEKEFWSLDAPALARDAGAAAGYRDRGRGGAGLGPARGEGPRPADDSRPRHRDRGDSPGAAQRTAGTRAGSASTSPRARRGRPAPMPCGSGLGDRARFAVADWTAGIAGRFDIVVSNPPYIRIGDIPELPLEVSRFDPQIALDGGAGWTRCLSCDSRPARRDSGGRWRRLPRSRRRPGGSRSRELAEMLGFEAHRHKDLVGIDRVVELRRGKRPRQKLGLEIGSETARFRAP